jgi:hypothetical protein
VYANLCEKPYTPDPETQHNDVKLKITTKIAFKPGGRAD